MTDPLETTLQARFHADAAQAPLPAPDLAATVRARVRRHRQLLAVVAAIAILLLGVAVTASETGVNRSAPPAGNSPTPESDLVQHARADLDAYARAVAAADPALDFSVIGDLVQQEGDWEAAMGAEGKQALADHNVVVTAAGEQQMALLESASHRISWVGGDTAPVPTQGAREILTAFTAAAPQQADCPTCPALQVIAAAPATMTLHTSKGDAQTPAWRYTLGGTRVTLLAAAIPPTGLITVPPPAAGPSGAQPVDTVTVASRESDQLTAHFGGARGDATSPCGADYTAVAVESDRAVVVIVTGTEYAGYEDAVCAMVAVERTADVHLTRPLGDRAVLDVASGQPLPVVTSN